MGMGNEKNTELGTSIEYIDISGVLFEGPARPLICSSVYRLRESNKTPV